MSYYKMLRVLETEYKADVLELDMLFRINGLFDIVKGEKRLTVIDLTNFNKAIHFEKEDDLLMWAVEKITTTEKRDAFKPEKNGISYREFKHRMNADKIINLNNRPEFNHWDKHKDSFSEDHLYILISGKVVKIGRSKDPSQRLQQLKTGLIEKNYTVYVFNRKGLMEKILHNCFKDYNTSGEWFQYNILIKNFIKKYFNRSSGYKIDGFVGSIKS